MAYFDREHVDRINYFEELFARLDELEDLALNEYEIEDLAQDNNLKLLQTLILFDMENQSNREGSDSFDRYGRPWELKTCNANLVTGFSTNHHTNLERISIFRQENWLFSIYRGIKLQEVYALSAEMLEPYFEKWEADVAAQIRAGNPGAHKNNPKIPIKYVVQNGIRVYPFTNPPIDPAELFHR